MYIHRQLEKEIIPILAEKEIIAVIGPRQAGKTSLFAYLNNELSASGKKTKFLSFEKRTDLELFDQDLESFKKIISDYEVVFIDEFQYGKNGGKSLKYLYDETVGKIKFIISGSSSLELKFQTGKYLVGRCFTFELSPFSFRECLAAQNSEYLKLLDEDKFSDILNFSANDSLSPVVNKELARLFEQYAVFGGYPRVVLTSDWKIKAKVLISIFDNYLLKDISDLLKIADSEGISKMIKLLSAQIGQLISYNKIGADSGLSFKEVKKYLSVLENTFIIKLLSPYFTNKRKEVVKNPKVYFCDLGLRNFCLNDFRSFDERENFGFLPENYVFNLLKNKYSAFASPIRFWRTKSKAEVDFIIERNGKIYPLEVKYSSQASVSRSLHSFIKKFQPEKAIVLTKDFVYSTKVGKTDVEFFPLLYF